MRKLLPLLALAASCAEPAFAQDLTARSLTTLSDSARIAALEARVAMLDSIVGTKGFLSPPIPCDSMEARRPTWYFPNGEYATDYRTKQFGCAFGPVAAKAGEVSVLQNSVFGLAARLAPVEAAVAGGYQIGTAVFDRIRANKVCIGDTGCNDDWQAQLQIRGNYSAIIGVESNLLKLDPQDPTHTHVGQFSLSQDGGVRTQQNAMLTFSRGYITNVNPCRPAMNAGGDSRSAWSYAKGSVNEDTCTNIPHDPTQDFVLDTDEGLRGTVMRMWRPNWFLYFQYSSSIHAGDILAPAPRQ